MTVDNEMLLHCSVVRSCNEVSTWSVVDADRPIGSCTRHGAAAERLGYRVCRISDTDGVRAHNG